MTFGLRGVDYEIDLNAKNVAALEKLLEKYMAVGRRVVHHRASSGKAAKRTLSSPDTASIRAWA